LDRQQELEEGMKRQQFLFNELQHRVNNMLTTTRAVARRTRAHSANLDQFAKALDDRLSALARIHNLFSRPGKTAATMREILTQELSAQGAVEGDNFVQRGPHIALPAREAELLSMAFHELATNALKHGALSAKDGRVCITWVINRAENGEHVLVRWERCLN
jgi:two-component sensor histidine kinase